MKINKLVRLLTFPMIVCQFIEAEASYDWQLTPSFTGTMTATVNGFDVAGTNINGSIYAGFDPSGSPINLSELGSRLTLTGKIELGGSLRVPTNHSNSIRIGVLNDNNSPDTRGWFGYFSGVDVNVGTSNGGIDRRSGASTDFFNRSNITQLQAFESTVPTLLPTFYDFSFEMIRVSSGIMITTLINESADNSKILISATAVDLNPSTYEFNRFTFQTYGDNLGTEKFNVTNLVLSHGQIPEPSSMIPAVTATSIIFWKLARKKHRKVIKSIK